MSKYVEWGYEARFSLDGTFYEQGEGMSESEARDFVDRMQSSEDETYGEDGDHHVTFKLRSRDVVKTDWAERL